MNPILQCLVHSEGDGVEHIIFNWFIPYSKIDADKVANQLIKNLSSKIQLFENWNNEKI